MKTMNEHLNPICRYEQSYLIHLNVPTLESHSTKTLITLHRTNHTYKLNIVANPSTKSLHHLMGLVKSFI